VFPYIYLSNKLTVVKLLVCAVSQLSGVFEDESVPGPSKLEANLSAAEAYFQASQRRIGMLHHENSLAAIQCAFLTGIYLMSTMQILAAYKCFVQASTQCLMYLSSRGWLHDTGSPKHSPSLARDGGVIHDRDTRTRHVVESLYWSCLKTEQFAFPFPSSFNALKEESCGLTKYT
jgi:hypothetical protein